MMSAMMLTTLSAGHDFCFEGKSLKAVEAWSKNDLASYYSALSLGLRYVTLDRKDFFGVSALVMYLSGHDSFRCQSCA